MPFSINGLGLAGILVYFLIMLGKYMGLEVAEADATTFVQNILGVVGFLMTLYHQYNRTDVKFGVIKK